MKRLLITLLISTIFFSGIAWSSDSHEEALYGHASESLMDINPHHNQSGNADDHCCHAAAHMLGVFSISSSVIYLARITNTLPSSIGFHSLVVTPPTPPPTS